MLGFVGVLLNLLESFRSVAYPKSIKKSKTMGSVNSRMEVGNKVKSKLFNSEITSDVCFVVGDQKTKFYAHRAILSMYGDVFKQMFFGDLKEKGQEIEVLDLEPVGFENMLK